jgi:hypothetical protein
MLQALRQLSNEVASLRGDVKTACLSSNPQVPAPAAAKAAGSAKQAKSKSKENPASDAAPAPPAKAVDVEEKEKPLPAAKIPPPASQAWAPTVAFDATIHASVLSAPLASLAVAYILKVSLFCFI